MKIPVLALGLIGIATHLVAQTPAKPAGVTCSIAAHPKTDADRLFGSGKFVDAEAAYTQQISASPSEAAWQGLVHSQIELNKVSEALASAAKANAAIPHSAAMRVLTGDAEFRAGHLDNASTAYNDARTLDPCSAAAHFGAARLLELSSMHKSAQRELAFAHRLDPADATISEALFATLPSAMHAKGLHNLLASDQDLSPEHRGRLEQEVALLDAGATCVSIEASGIQRIDLTPLFTDGVHLRDYALRLQTGAGDAVNLDMDSTAAGIVLTENDAKKLKVTPAIADHQSPPYLGYLPSIQIGPLKYQKCPVSVVSNAALGNRYSVIGTNFFRDSLIHLDYKTKQLTLTPYSDAKPSTSDPLLVDAAVPAGEETWSRVLIDDQRILMPALLQKKPIGLVMLDTSWTLQMLSPAVAKQFNPSEGETLRINGVSGDFVRIFVDPESGSLERSQLFDTDGHLIPLRKAASQQSLRFAGVEAPTMTFWTFDITRVSHDAGIEVSGMIGFYVMFQYFTDIDYRNGLINLKYNPDVRDPFR